MSELPINQVVCGAFPAATRGWPDEKINLVMFSPPYWGLRNYGENVNAVWGGDPGCEHEWNEEQFAKNTNRNAIDSSGLINSLEYTKERHRQGTHTSQGCFCAKCGAWYGQLGLEPTYQMYVEHLVEVGREIKRILRKDGSWYLNLGDTYSSQGGPQVEQTKNASHGIPPIQPNRKTNIPAKCKLLIPYRVALALIDDGWICRNDVTWYKPNCMPSSVKDRLTTQTERVFHFVKYRKYYYDLDAIREPHKASAEKVKYHNDYERKQGSHFADRQTGRAKELEKKNGVVVAYNPLGKNPGDVVSYKGKFAESCEDFNSPRARTAREGYDGSAHFYHPAGKNPGDFWTINTRPFPEAHFAVYPGELCVRPIKSSCPPNGIVLDPMCGAGTTLKEAKRLGRRYIGIDIKPEYVEMTKRGLSQVEWPLEAYSL